MIHQHVPVEATRTTTYVLVGLWQSVGRHLAHNSAGVRRIIEKFEGQFPMLDVNEVGKGVSMQEFNVHDRCIGLRARQR